MTKYIRSASLLLALLSVSMAVPACTTTGAPPPTVVTKISETVDCSAEKVKSQIPAIIVDVTTDLLSKDYVRLLEKIGQRVGMDAVVCAVALSGVAAENRKASHPSAESPNADAITENAAAYLRAREVRFASPPGEASRAAMIYCLPACNACMVCTYIQPPVGVPPSLHGICLPRSPKPAGCP